MKTKIYGILIIIFLYSCVKVPITNRRQMKLLPESTLIGLGTTSYREFLSGNPALPQSNINAQMIKTVGERVSSATSLYLRENGHGKRVAGYSWEFNLVNNNAVNAWCMPGGKIVFYNGILPYTQDENGVAVVMAHEIAHAVARHGNERMSQQLLLALGGVSLDVALSSKPDETRDLFLMTYGIGSTLGALAYSRQHEYEADKLGMVFMALAGYDPEHALRFWQRMSQINAPKLPEFVSTHPSDVNRINEIQAFMPKAKKYYKPRN
ncbi:MAG: M48 family metallopeptidase [Bacteroidales bacterium]|nr:M48 family metallopeptidase [Bacteroidales bacterium]